MTSKKNAYPIMAFTVLCLGVFGPIYAQFQLAPLAPQLMEKLDLSMGEFASIFSSALIAGIFLSLLAGVLLDKYGVKKIVSIGLAITAFGAIWRIWSDSYITLFISMLLTGVGPAVLIANSAKIIGSWFSLERVGGKIGIFLAVSTLSMTIGTGTTALLPSIQVAYLLAAIITTVSFILWVIVIKEPALENDSKLSMKVTKSLKTVTKYRAVWVVGFCVLFLTGCNMIISSFLPTALGVQGINNVAAGIFASLFTGGSFIGCLIVPNITSRLGKNKPVILVLAIIAAFGTAFGWLAPNGVLLGISIAITGIAIGGSMPIFFSTPIQMPEIGLTYAGVAGGFVSTLQVLGAVIIPTHIIAPIAGENINLFFILGGACMIFVFMFALVLPELGKNVWQTPNIKINKSQF